MARNTQQDSQSLVIVESPAKAKTINRYLGPGYTVMASMGHVRDLPPNDLGIDLAHDFEPVYQVLNAKRRVVGDLRKAAAKAKEVYLATDLDREGEAIAWHLVHALDLPPGRTRRVLFNEITKSAIRAAFASPRELDMDKVNAQQARRLLDRLVGYQLSPLIQAKIAKGLSAGRVQSVAVRLIVSREVEIRSFVPKESWRLLGTFAIEPDKSVHHAEGWKKFLAGAKDPQTGRTLKERQSWLARHQCLSAELVKLDGQNFQGGDSVEAKALAETLGFVTEKVEESDFEAYKDKGLKRIVLRGRTDPDNAPSFHIKDVQRRRTTTKPNAPFTTATVQQAASSALGFAPARTMRVAQQLYEGIDLGGADGAVGLITYMRTDSTNMSAESVDAARGLIRSTFGESYLPSKPVAYTSAKRAQEAHEAIRPTDVARNPDSLRSALTADQFKLYRLIWQRFVACQMKPAQWESTTVLLAAATPRGEAVFKASGRRLVFDGFMRVTGIAENGELLLPEMHAGAPIGLFDLEPQQQYTSPPPRYTEASLVKKLESEGIGRPSTYAAIIQTIQDRGYAELVDKKFHPTDRGEVVTKRLETHFPKIMDIKFTSYMEEELDKIEEAHLDWIHVLGEFYRPFKEALDKAREEMQPARAEPSEYTCPECGRDMVYRLGRNGRFLACSGYPECTYSRNVDREGKPVEEVVVDEACAECGSAMVLRKSRLGPFLGCTRYPECTYTVPCDENGVPLKKVTPEEIKEQCSECGSPMAVKFGRGKAFLGCTAYPKCRATRPLPPGVYVEKPKPEDAGVRCNKCGRPMVIRRSRRGPFLSCSGFPRCRNAMPLDQRDHLRRLEEEGQIPDPPAEPSNNGSSRTAARKRAAKSGGKVDLESLGPPPEGFAWTRTGRPVVETWPEEPLTCPDCGRDVTLKTGRFGPYYGCTGYPKCSFVANLRGEAKKRAEAELPTPPKPKPVATEVPCEECGAPMLVRTGRTGPFLGCSRYPKCRFSKPIPEGETAETLAAGK